MDQKAGYFSDLKGSKNISVLCFRAAMSTSAGVWLKEYPLEFSFPLFLAQLSVIFIACHLVHALLRRIGLPQVISHTIAGIILGPTCLSRNSTFQETIFPLRSWIHLDLFAQFSFVLFIFVVGVKTDFSLIRQSGHKVVSIAVGGTIIPYIFIIIAATASNSIIENDLYGNIVTNMARRWAVTSNTVVSCLLTEFNLLTSNLGRLAISASLIAEFMVVILTAIFNGLLYSGAGFSMVKSFLSFFGLIAFIWVVARPIAVWVVRRTPDGGSLEDDCFVLVILLALASSVLGELAGETLMAGPLILGLLLPSGPPLGTALVDRLMSIGSEVFLPVFFAAAGLRTNLYDFSPLRTGSNWSEWSFTAYLIIFGVIGKFIGVIIPCIYNKMGLRNSFIMSIILSCHGVVEIFSFNGWEDVKKADSEIYSMNMLALVVVGGLSGVLIKTLYGTANRLAAGKRRTVQGVGSMGELRVLTCVHGEENVPPFLALIDIIHPANVSPLCVYLLHLSPLAGKINATLVAYKSVSMGSISDRIVKSFRELEKKHPPSYLALVPFTGISPYATMHDDICSLSQDKMVDLIILPFHRRVGSILYPDYIKPAIQAVNNNVLMYAPCTTAILVDHGLAGGAIFSMGTSHRITVFFIGGSDDHEALALITRMIDNPSTKVDVIRFLLPRDLAEEERDELDDKVMENFLVRHGKNERVSYAEEEVSEGSEMVSVMRIRCEECNLIVVGRREGRLSRITSGLEIWSEFHELGVVGDVLASPDFGRKASVLVVQNPIKMEASSSFATRKVPMTRSDPTRTDQCLNEHENSAVSDINFGNMGTERLITEGEREA